MVRTSSDRVRWGALGTARIVETGFAPAVAGDPRSELVAVATRRPADAAAFAARVGALRVHDGYGALLADADVDIVYVPLPNALHREWVIAALEAGKHVLCEKPLALTAADARAMFAAAERAGRILLEGFMWRYHPRVDRVRRIIADELGPLRLVRIAYTYDLGANHPTEAARARDIRLSSELGGGALADIGSYTVSGLRAYAGSRPRQVTTELLVEENGVDMRFAGQILFQDDVVGQFYVAMDVPGGALLDVQGDRGRLRMLNAFRTAREWGDPVIEVTPVTGPARVETVPFADQFELEVAAITAVLLDGAAPLIPPADSIENAETLDAVRRSWTEKVVTMPPHEAERSTGS